MYSPSSGSILSPYDLNHHHLAHTMGFSTHSSQLTSTTSNATSDTSTISTSSGRCLTFKYFTTFLICTTCLALLCASLATHKWIVSRPIRIIKLNGAPTNFTALMLTALGQEDDIHQSPSARRQQKAISSSSSSYQVESSQDLTSSEFFVPYSQAATSQQQNNKFQGQIYFGLFSGVKVLNYGFGDRASQISVVQPFFSRDATREKNVAEPAVIAETLVDFRFWLITLLAVIFAIIFALVGAIFALINFVLTPKSKLSGPFGLVIWNSAACFCCLIALSSWLVEFMMKLKSNVLTTEEVFNGWTSEDRSQFGYSYYFVASSLILHLVNVSIVSLVQFSNWTRDKVAKRQARSSCEGVIMLY